MKYLFVFLAALVLAACGGSPAPTADAPTAAPAVPTAIPLEQIDLEPLLVQSGDLPAGTTGAQVRDTAPAMFKDIPAATNTAYQQLATGAKQTGGVAVFLYADAAPRDAAYQAIATGMGSDTSAPTIGERAALSAGGDILPFSDLLFQRCRAVAHIRMTGSDAAAIESYAKRLDKRLQAVAC